MEMGNTAMIEYLRLAGAEEVIKEIPRIKGGYSGLRGLRCKNYQDGGQGKWRGKCGKRKGKKKGGKTKQAAAGNKKQQGGRKKGQKKK